MDYPMPYDLQLTHDINVHSTSMAIMPNQRQDGPNAGHFHTLMPGVYMLSFSYDGAQQSELRVITPDGNQRFRVRIEAGAEGVARQSPMIRISVTSATGDRLHVISPTTTGGSGRATISVYPVQLYSPEISGGGG